MSDQKINIVLNTNIRLVIKTSLANRGVKKKLRFSFTTIQDQYKMSQNQFKKTETQLKR